MTLYRYQNRRVTAQWYNEYVVSGKLPSPLSENLKAAIETARLIHPNPPDSTAPRRLLL